MRTRRVILLLTLALAAFTPEVAWAHCDSVSGPVAVDARRALQHEAFQTVAIWVGEEQHQALRTVYEEVLPVYRMGGKAGEVAERYFMETAVRLHRLAEGMTYEGLKPEQPLPPDIAAAEKALETGDLEPVIDLLASEMEEGVRKYFEKARAGLEDKDRSLTSGRDWADAYVKYVIYVHGLHRKIKAGPKHGIGE